MIDSAKSSLPNILVAILSTQNLVGRRKAVRETWLKDLHDADYRFFVGNGGWKQEEDTVVLDCDDSYECLPDKMTRVARWALDHDYDFIFKCDDDTYVNIERLFASGFEQHHFSGFIEDRDCHKRAYPFRVYPHPQGGSGYWLDRCAMYVVARGLEGNAEDFGVGECLDRARILGFHDPRYSHVDIPAIRERLLDENQFITLHKCDPREMRRVHERTSSACIAG
jgi:hypothetical protein